MKPKFSKLRALFYKIFFPSNLKITGFCSKCGSCCRKMFIIEGGKMLADEKLFQEVQKLVPFYKNLTITGKNSNGELYFTCNLLKNNTCSTYTKRPKICRDYPSVKSHLYGGVLFSDCTFKLTPRKSFEYFLGLR